MINKIFFTKLIEEYSKYNSNRGEVINQSRDILREAKTSIFASHRDDLEQAEKSLKNAEKIINILLQKVKNSRINYEGAFRAGLEEYAEAKLFYNFLVTGKVEEIKEVKLDFETYIGALSDFTGELVRRAVLKATKGDLKDVIELHKVTEEVINQFIKFDLLSNLRNKFDQGKKNLRKLEEIMYDLSMAQSRRK